MWRKEGYKNNVKKEYGDFVYSLPETMNKCIDMFLEKYKSVDKYLLECGLSRKQIENIRCHFIE
jgi:vesicle coat complex subunit